MTRGVLIYAHNNTEIDYLRVACANALMIKRNLNVPVTLVSDAGTLEWGIKDLGQDFLDSCFEQILTVNRNHSFNNRRNYNDTSYTTKPLQFYNCNHWEAYSLSPYDETLFIDADYLIMSSALSNCWGSDNDVMLDYRIYTLADAGRPHEKNIDEFGIRQYWATVIYFKKSPFAEALFSAVKHVQENYRYYKDLYYFSNGMFRNDNAFSIAVHTLNGFTQGNMSAVGNLPIPGLLMSWDTDDIHSVPGVNNIMMYGEIPTSKGQYTLVSIRDTDIHIMNKWAINRVSNRLIELYKDDVK